ncbi:hypothetical protein GW17_00046506 [Ensete ventricosum]|nr:hypothetical protein GW17_00046506 [Ensete ventricosum]
MPMVHDVPQRKIQPLDQSSMPKEKPETRRQELRELAVSEEVKRRQEPPHSAIPEELKQMRQQAPVMRRTKQQDPLICQSKHEGILNKPSKPVILDSGPGRPTKLVCSLKAGGEMKPKQHQDDARPRRKQLVTTQDVSSIRS